MKIEKRIEELDIELPESSPAKAEYLPVKRTGNLLFVSGQIPIKEDKILYKGKLKKDEDIQYGQNAAVLCTINMMAALKDYLKNLDYIKEVVKIQGFVNSEVGFDKQHLVINEASKLLFEIFGEKGRHSRTAVGTNQLPLDITVEIEGIFEIGDEYFNEI